MKAILMSIQAKHLVNILNGKKTLEIRKSLPVGFVGYVYLYCTKAKPYLYYTYEEISFDLVDDNDYKDMTLNGKVVARFWLDLVEDVLMHDTGDNFINEFDPIFCTDTLDYYHVNKLSCLSNDELFKYQGMNGLIYAWHIKNLELLDKPKELRGFYNYKFYHAGFDLSKLKKGETINAVKFDEMARVTRAPQSWMYVEVEE